MIRIRGIFGVLLAGLTVGGALAQTREVCLEDRAGLNAPTMGSFYQELQLLVGPRGVKIEDEDCRADAIRIALHRSAPHQPSDVLGAAPIAGSQIAPQLEVYVDRVVELMPERQCWNVVGRALARVAAHEVAHYLGQQQQHSDTGVLQAGFSGAQLASEDSYPFRWISTSTAPKPATH
jgi:hypothetical protein